MSLIRGQSLSTKEIGDQVDDFSAKEDNQTCAIRGVCDDHVARSSAKIEGVNATLDANQADLKNHVAALLALRANHPALYQGSRTNLLADATRYADLKQSGEDRVLFLLNTSQMTEQFSFSAAELGSAIELVDLLDNHTRLTPIKGVYTIPMDPLQARFLQVKISD